MPFSACTARRRPSNSQSSSGASNWAPSSQTMALVGQRKVASGPGSKSVLKSMTGSPPCMVTVCAGASAAHRPQASHATAQSARASSPARGELHWTNSLCSSGASTNRSSGQTSTQSLQATQAEIETWGSPSAPIAIASKSQDSSQSPSPRQPQGQARPPPSTTAAARQEPRPW